MPHSVGSATAAERPRLVLLHGFTQSASSWRPVLPHLAGFDVQALDLPGHGASGERAAGLVDGAAQLAAAGGKGTWVGYSMGGRFALHVALARPDLVERLVLIGAHPGIESDSERSARRRADEALAARIVSVGLPTFLEEWLAQPLFARLADEARGLESRLGNRPEALAAALVRAGAGAQEPAWPRLHSLEMPLLYVVGQHDAKYRAVGARLVAAVKKGTLAVVPGAGHSVPFERPQAFAAALRDWLGERPATR
ncbi:MAG: alpha/beta fold hydrolase [Gemmatimonadota bacterium]